MISDILLMGLGTRMQDPCVDVAFWAPSRSSLSTLFENHLKLSELDSDMLQQGFDLVQGC